MRKSMLWITLFVLLTTLCGCAATAEDLMGEAEGYGGTLKVAVTMDGEKITRVAVTSHSETEGIGTRAIADLPNKIVAANSADVDVVSGATVTSKAIMAAVKNAMSGGGAQTTGGADMAQTTDGTGMGGTAQATDGTGMGGASNSPAALSSTSQPADAMRCGLGMSAMGRVGPGSDNDGNQVYSINVVYAFAAFDGDGRITQVRVDQLEVATPNYDGATMPHFSGFPGQGGYALWDDKAGKVSGTTDDTEDNFLTEISGWVSKRERGEEYKLKSGSWASEMDIFERMFVGKTMDEIEAWFDRCFSDVNGRPLTAESSAEGDAKKYEALSADEKQQLTDLTSGATMSLRDSHGDILAALRKAWDAAQQTSTAK